MTLIVLIVGGAVIITVPSLTQYWGKQDSGHALVVDVTTLKMTRKPVKLQRKVQQDALGKVNRVKEINRRE